MFQHENNGTEVGVSLFVYVVTLNIHKNCCLAKFLSKDAIYVTSYFSFYLLCICGNYKRYICLWILMDLCDNVPVVPEAYNAPAVKQICFLWFLLVNGLRTRCFVTKQVKRRLHNVCPLHTGLCYSYGMLHE